MGGNILHELVKEAHVWMDKYMKSYYHEDENIMHGIRQKEVHTGYVTTIARQLAQDLKLNEHDTFIAELSGLWHDVGRFHQWTVYQTFNDKISEDHAALSVKVMKDLPAFQKLSSEDQDILEFAIFNHNKKDIAPAPSEKHLMFAKIIRDADKLDIYRVLEPLLEPSDGKGFCPGFLEKFVEGEQVDYTMMITKDDRKLVRLMWAYDINFPWTMIKLQEKGYFSRIIANLPTKDPLVKQGVDRLLAHVDKMCAQYKK